MTWWPKKSNDTSKLARYGEKFAPYRGLLPDLQARICLGTSRWRNLHVVSCTIGADDKGLIISGDTLTRELKLAIHLESIIFEDLPPGTRLNARQLQERIDCSTPGQKKRAFQRGLVRGPLLLDDERMESEP